MKDSVREERYKLLLTQVESLLSGEKNLIANLANVAAAIYDAFDFHWVGFYLVDRVAPDELVLGPFQGPVACTRIRKGKGVCGACWEQNRVQLVDNVHEFPGHIACSSYSNSEIVIPLKDASQLVIGVLDIDSCKYADFKEVDVYYLEKIVALIALP